MDKKFLRISILTFGLISTGLLSCDSYAGNKEYTTGCDCLCEGNDHLGNVAHIGLCDYMCVIGHKKKMQSCRACTAEAPC